MTRYGFGIFILRLIIPTMILASIIVRPSLMGSIYLGMLLYLPYLDLIENERLNKGAFNYVMTFVPYQTAAIQLGFYLYTISTDEIHLEENSNMLRLFKSLGMSTLDDLSAFQVYCWVGPEGLMVIVSILYRWSMGMIGKGNTHESEETNEKAELEAKKEKMSYLKMSTTIGKSFTVFLIFVDAVWQHTIFGVCYYLIFLFIISMWALNQALSNHVSMVLKLSSPILLVHVVGIYVFQIEGIQFNLLDKSTVLRNTEWRRRNACIKKNGELEGKC
ncbi:unnamed protein product [Acanthoscelides obtectus]|uniref:Piezo TM1-24 domain-containing protein n=1 Tax=Acanthoscelides obtectus TaxID=200917 RepID=A0A9P0LIZ5_ACAOB|nr:unnamed protein product [Acanthoscelides obtectus]CAK1620749.1 hypothetical protein AOBTE_LOCUS537 [Acanthoscelides obtectus]